MRLIDADALAKELLSLTWLGCDGGYYKGMADERGSMLRRIADAPTIEPVKRGKWVERADVMECSECHNEWDYCDNDTHRFGFCPSCGADMRSEATNEQD